MSRFVADESGMTAAEYGMLLGFVAILVIAVLKLFSSSVVAWFATKVAAITSL